MKRFVVAAAVVVLLSPVARAGDKTTEAMVDASSLNGGANGFINGTSAGKIASKGCAIQVQVKGLSTSVVADGDVLICLLGADIFTAQLPVIANSPYGNSLIIQAEAKKGSIKAKADITALGCGGGNKTTNFNGSGQCYLADDAYRLTWQEICTGVGMVPLGFSDAKCPDPLADPKKCNVLGVCQGLVAGGAQRIPAPSSGLIAQQGSTIQ